MSRTPLTTRQISTAGLGRMWPGGEVIFEEGRSMTFLSHFRIAFLLLWIKGKEPMVERISVKRSEERLACLYVHSAACTAVAFTVILGGIMGKLDLFLS